MNSTFNFPSQPVNMANPIPPIVNQPNPTYTNPFANNGFTPQVGQYPAYNAYGNLGTGFTSGQQFNNDQVIKINPQVMNLVNPIIETMTQYEMFQKANAAFGMWDPKNSLNDYEKKKFDEVKKQCVHLIRDIQSGKLVPTLEEVDDTMFKCRICGREIYKKFDKTAVERLKDAIPVLNMLAFFSMPLNITSEHMSKIIFMKQSMGDMIQLVDILNNFVKEEDSAIANTVNIGEAAKNATFRIGGLTGFSSL